MTGEAILIGVWIGGGLIISLTGFYLAAKHNVDLAGPGAASLGFIAVGWPLLAAISPLFGLLMLAGYLGSRARK